MLKEPLLDEEEPVSANKYNTFVSKEMSVENEYKKEEEYNINDNNNNNNNINNKSNSPDSDVSKHSQNVSVTIRSDGPIGSNTNVFDELRKKATSTKGGIRVDSHLLYRTIPKLEEMFFDVRTTTVTMIHCGFVLLFCALIICGALGHSNAWIYGTSIGLLTNLFGVVHSTYSGRQSAMLSHSDNAMQSLGKVIGKFAIALNIQESYLVSAKNLINLLDHYTLLIDDKYPNLFSIINANNNDGIDYKEICVTYCAFMQKLKFSLKKQHKKWLSTFFEQYKLLDNRFGITKKEYFDFVRKLPNKTRMLFQSMSGLEQRFIYLSAASIAPENAQEKSELLLDLKKYKSVGTYSQEIGDEAVLLYKEMDELVRKVLSDLANTNSRVEHALHLKMLEKEKQRKTHKKKRGKLEEKQQSNDYNDNGKNDNYDSVSPLHSDIRNSMVLTHRLSVSMARDLNETASSLINRPKRSGTAPSLNAKQRKHSSNAVGSAFEFKFELQFESDGDDDDDHDLDYDYQTTETAL